MDEPIANSSRLVLPSTIAPASRSLVMTVASYGGFQPSRMRDPHVVGNSCVQMMSLIATGSPASGGSPSPFARRSSQRFAAASADGRSTDRKAWMCGSSVSMRSRQARTSSAEEISRRCSRSRSVEAGRSIRSLAPSR